MSRVNDAPRSLAATGAQDNRETTSATGFTATPIRAQEPRPVHHALHGAMREVVGRAIAAGTPIPAAFLKYAPRHFGT